MSVGWRARWGLVPALVAGLACSGSSRETAPPAAPSPPETAPPAAPSPPVIISLFDARIGIPRAAEDLTRLTERLPDDVPAIRFTSEELEAACPRPGRLAMRPLPAAAARLIDAESLEGRHVPFTFSHGDEQLFAGIMYPSFGAAGITVPVMHVSREEEDFWLLIGRTQGEWAGAGPPSGQQARKRNASDFLDLLAECSLL